MGRDKTQLIVDGSTIAVRTGRLLRLVVETAIEVGPGVTGLPAVLEHPPGSGPLAAIAAGRSELLARGHTGSALVIACDLPLLSEPLLRLLVDWQAPNSVVPVVAGRAQPLCARWSGGDLDRALDLVAQGVRSLRHLSTQDDVVLLQATDWQMAASDVEFSDVDTPDDLRRIGIED